MVLNKDRKQNLVPRRSTSFYLSPDSQTMAADVTTTIPRDSRILSISETSTDAAITVVLNWRAATID